MKSGSTRSETERLREPTAEVAAELGLPNRKRNAPRLVVGRREWVALPEFGAGPFHAKTDTGARSSSVHAEAIEFLEDEGRVRFRTRDHHGHVVACECDVFRTGRVRSSTGEAKLRIFIETDLLLAGGYRWRIRLTLADRSEMRCSMLLGRQALAGSFLVDPQGDHLAGGMHELEKFLPERERDD